MAIKVYLGSNHDVHWQRQAWLAASYALTSWAKFGLSPVIDWIGTPSWENMSRRSLLAFDGQHAANPREPGFKPRESETNRIVGGRFREERGDRAIDFNSTGAFEVFREQFLNVIGARTAKQNNGYAVTLVAHSAGALVLNDWLHRDLLDEINYSYPNIVYMAAACSVRDFHRTVVPYMLFHPGASSMG